MNELFRGNIFNHNDLDVNAGKKCQGSDIGAENYFLPKRYEDIIKIPLRENAIQQIWETCSLNYQLFQELYLTPIIQLLSRVQCVPACRGGCYSGIDGFTDLTLRFTSYAVRLAKGYLFPTGAASEELSAKSEIWGAVIFFSALFYHLPLLKVLQGEMKSGQKWIPGLQKPADYFRFRFCNDMTENQQREKINVLIGMRLLPSKALDWLSTTPDALHCLMEIICGQVCSQNTISNVLTETAKVIDSPLLDSTLNFSGKNIVREEGIISFATEVQPILKEYIAKEEKSNRSCIVENGELGCDDNNKKHVSEGKYFWSWLSENLKRGKIEINQEGSKVHVIGDLIFVSVPDIFYFYIKSTVSKLSRERIQSSFERLKYHCVSEGNKYKKAKIYFSDSGKEKFKWRSGYLIKASAIYNGGPTPQDSELVVLD